MPSRYYQSYKKNDSDDSDENYDPNEPVKRLVKYVKYIKEKITITSLEELESGMDGSNARLYLDGDEVSFSKRLVHQMGRDGRPNFRSDPIDMLYYLDGVKYSSDDMEEFIRNEMLKIMIILRRVSKKYIEISDSDSRLVGDDVPDDELEEGDYKIVKPDYNMNFGWY